MQMRSSLAKDIFFQDTEHIYQQQTVYRNTLRNSVKEIMAEIISGINAGHFDNPVMEKQLADLSSKLSRTSGKKVYGYLKADVKAMIDSIVDELGKEEHIAALYDLWYEKKYEALQIYTDNLPARVPLSQNAEFKPIKNMVIQEAMKLLQPDREVEDETNEELLEPMEQEVYWEDELPDEEYRIGIGTNQDLAKAREYFLKAVSSQNINAYYGLWQVLKQEQNYTEAIRYLMQAAKRGHINAEYELGKAFFCGDHVPQDIYYGTRWLELAVKQNSRDAKAFLGAEYLKGNRLPKDLGKALQYLIEASERGNTAAKYYLGKLYLDGIEVVQNVPKALQLLNEAAEKGQEAAQYLLAKTYLDGRLIMRDVSKAIDLFTGLAEKENTPAAYQLGKLFFKGELVERSIPETVKWLQRCSTDQHALYLLGKIYLYGIGIPPDKEKGLHYLQRAVIQGNHYAERLLEAYRNNQNYRLATGMFRLLQSTAGLFESKVDQDGREISLVESKLLREIREKKATLGIRG